MSDSELQSFQDELYQDHYSEEYQMCLAEEALEYEDENNFTLSLPFTEAEEAVGFLEALATNSTSGSGIGGGAKMARLGTQIPKLRKAYEQLLIDFEKQLNQKIAQAPKTAKGAKALAKWAVKRRKEIADFIRRQQGISSKALFEVRDSVKYGMGGRTYENMAAYTQKKAARKGIRLSDLEVDESLIESALRSNKEVSKGAKNGAKYLKHGGKILLVFSISATAYTLLTAPEGELERIIYEEIGGAAGGWMGAGLGAGGCLVFGIATSGWGLLACGVVGGFAGGVGGSIAGEKIYYFKSKKTERSLDQATINLLHQSDLQTEIPMCYME